MTSDSNTEARIQRLESIVSRLWSAVCCLQKRTAVKAAKLRVGYTSSVVVGDLRVTTPIASKLKRVSCAFTHATVRALSAGASKHKRVTAAATYTQTHTVSATVSKHKGISAAVTWAGTLALSALASKVKAVTAAVVYLPAIILSAAAAKSKAVSAAFTYLPAIGVSGLAAKQKATSATVSYSGSAVGYAGLVADDPSSGTQVWNFPSQAEGNQTITNTGASVPTVADSTHLLVASQFALAVPSGATITGIQVDIYRRGTASLFNVIDLLAQPSNGSGLIGTDQSFGVAWTAFGADQSFGGPTSNMGLTLTPALVNDTAFGFTLQAGADGTDGALAALVYRFRATIFYTL